MGIKWKFAPPTQPSLTLLPPRSQLCFTTGWRAAARAFTRSTSVRCLCSQVQELPLLCPCKLYKVCIPLSTLSHSHFTHISSMSLSSPSCHTLIYFYLIPVSLSSPFCLTLFFFISLSSHSPCISLPLHSELHPISLLFSSSSLPHITPISFIAQRSPSCLTLILFSCSSLHT